MVNNLKFFSELGGGTSELSRLAEGYKPLSENEMNKPLTLENCKTDSLNLRTRNLLSLEIPLILLVKA